MEPFISDPIDTSDDIEFERLYQWFLAKRQELSRYYFVDKMVLDSEKGIVGVKLDVKRGEVVYKERVIK